MRIVCVHQGYELYGSDRCFVESVSALRAAFPQSQIEIVLPRKGPISGPLAPFADKISYEPLFVLRRKSLARLALTWPLALPAALWRARGRLVNADLCYINTSVVLDYQIMARFFPGRALLHIHEITTGRTRAIFRALALWSRARLVFNSRATRDSFAPPPDLPFDVIYNGLDGPAAPEPVAYDGSRPLRLALIGRINRIKGQDVLLSALARLPEAIRAQFSVRMVGGAFENPALESQLRRDVVAAGLEKIVAVEPFADDTAPIYAWADVVVAPSKLPESLGRTAIEAMAFARPALVSAIGGLTEVVADGQTGWHVPPGDAEALAQTLLLLIAAPGQWASFGRKARARYEALFSRRAAAEALAAAARAAARKPEAPALSLAAKTR